jgi:hypothetical protein
MNKSLSCLNLMKSATKKSAKTLTKPVLFIIFSLCFVVNATFAAPQDIYFDDMITLKVGRHLTQEFYEVKNDYDGSIYINIKDFMVFTELSEYSQLSIEGGSINLSMAGSLFPDNKTRQIKKELKSLKTTWIDDQLYFDKEGISKLLPLSSVNWLAEKYTLEILPDFSLPLDYRIAAQRRNRKVEDDKNNQLASDQKDFFMQKDRRLIDFGMIKFRYDLDDIESFFIKEKDHNKGRAGLEFSSQFLYGDINIRHGLYPIRELEGVSLKYPYIFKDKTVTFGDDFIQSNDILGYNSRIRGISVSDNDYTIKRSGKEVTIRGQAPTSAMVEIYQNGKVVDYQRVQGSDYEFTLDMRSQNDAFMINIFDRNGVLLEEKNINVMQGDEFLSQGEWDYNFFYGQNSAGVNKSWDDRKYGIAYGLTNNLSYSFDYFDTRNEDKLYHYTKHRLGYRFSNLAIPLVLQLSYYDSLADKSQGYIGEFESKVFSHKLSYRYEKYNHTLAIDENKDSYQKAVISGDYGRSDYFFRYSDKNYQDKKEINYDSGLSYDFTKALRMNVDLSKTVKKKTDRPPNYTGKIGLDYNLGDFTYNLNANYYQERDANWQYTARIRKRLRQNTNYSYRVDLSYNENDNFIIGMSFEYKFSDSLKTDTDYDSNRDKQYKVGASYETVVNMKKPFVGNNSKYTDNGYLEGRVFIDSNANGKKDMDEAPLMGVGVSIGKNEAKTNSTGAFYLSNISPYRSHKLSYNYSDVLVDPTLSTNSIKTVELIPASGKKLSVGLAPLSLIMGSIYLSDTEAKIRNKFFSYVEIVVEKNGHFYANVAPEYDGFFVVQDLKPGEYKLKINYLGSEKIILKKDSLEVIVLPGDTGGFYEGVDFNVSGIKSKTTPERITETYDAGMPEDFADTDAVLATEVNTLDDTAVEENIEDFNYEVSALEPEAEVEAEVDPVMVATQMQQQADDRYKPKGFIAEMMAKPALAGGIACATLLLLGLIGLGIKKTE